MSNGLRDALGFYVPGADDPTEEIELFSNAEWEALNKEISRPWKPPICECGSEKVYGEKANVHSEWCPKYWR